MNDKDKENIDQWEKEWSKLKYTRDEALKILSDDLNKTSGEIVNILKNRDVPLPDKIDEFTLQEIKDELENTSVVESFLENIILTKNDGRKRLGVNYGNINKNWFPSTKILRFTNNSQEPEDDELLQINGVDWLQKIPKNNKFDLIFGDFPWGMKPISYQLGDNDIKLPIGRIELIKSLSYLNEGGTGFFIMEPLALSGKLGSNFINALSHNGFFISAIFGVPQGLLKNTSITPNLIAISRKKTENILVAKLISHGQTFSLAGNYIDDKNRPKRVKINLDNLYNGIYIKLEDFHSIDRLDAQIQITKLETSYKQYAQHSLEKLSIEINACKTGGRFLEKENSIYIPKIGTSSVISTLSEATIKHQNYFQVVLSDRALNQYICSFFKSEIGKLTLKSLTTGSFIPHINKSDIVNLVVALPDLDTQKQVVETKNKITDLQEAINEFDKEVALNPDSSLEMINKLDDMLSAVGKLNDVDKVRAMVRGFETNAVEFKKTWRLPTRGEEGDAFNKASDRITATVFKVINSFINAKGGSLVIGVDDDTHEITGIECELNHFFKKDKDIKKKIDRFDNNFESKLKNAFLQDFIDLIAYRPVLIDDNYVWLVTCKPGPTPCLIQNNKTVNHLEGSDFFVREGANSVPKNGQARMDYIMGPRFSSN